MWTIALQSRLTETIKVRVGPPFKVTRFDDLGTALSKIPFKSYIPSIEHPLQLPKVTTSCHKSKLYHSDGVSERVSRYLRRYIYKLNSDQFKAQNEAESDPFNIPVFVRMKKDMCQVSVDAVGEQNRLFQRKSDTPKRVESGSIRETLAAATLVLSELRAGEHFWDPFCGSGTFLHEAISLIAGKPIDRERKFAFENWRTHDSDGFQIFKDQCKEPDYSTLDKMHLIASDISQQ